jgi:thioredoxin 1
MIAPVLEKISEEYEGQIVVAKVNTDEQAEWAMKFGVQGIPTLLFVKDGHVVREQVGALPEFAIRQLVDELLAAMPHENVH